MENLEDRSEDRDKREDNIKILEELIYKGNSEKQITDNHIDLKKIELRVAAARLFSEDGSGVDTDISDFLIVDRNPAEKISEILDVIPDMFPEMDFNLHSNEESRAKRFETGIEGIEYIDMTEDNFQTGEVGNESNEDLSIEKKLEEAGTSEIKESEDDKERKEKELREEHIKEVEKNLKLQQEELDKLYQDVLSEDEKQGEKEPETSEPEVSEIQPDRKKKIEDIDSSQKKNDGNEKKIDIMDDGRHKMTDRETISQKLQKISSFTDSIKDRFDRELEETLGKLPPKITEILKDKRFKITLAAALIIFLAYEINYLPYDQKMKIESQMAAEKNRGMTLQSKEALTVKKLSEVTEENKRDGTKFEELKKKLLLVEFKDPLELVEYIQKSIDEFGIKLDSIGKLSVIFENYDMQAPGTGGTENKVPEDYSLEKGIPKIEVPYEISSDFLETTEFIHELETGKAFIQLSNSPITISLNQNGKIYTSFIATAYSEQLKLGDKSLKDKLAEDNLKIRRDFFNRVNNEPIRKIIGDIRVISLRGKLYAVVKLKNGRSEALTDGKILKISESNGEDNEYLVSIVEREKEYIVSLKNIETLDTSDFSIERLE